MADDEHPTDGGRVAGATVGERLAEEVRHGRLTADDLAVLRTALGADAVPDAEPGGSAEARLRRVEGQLARLAAMADELEAFLDERGSARQFVADARADLDALERRLDAADARATRRADRLTDLEGVVPRQTGRLDRLERDVDELAATLEDLDDRLEALERDVATLTDWRTALGEAFEVD